MDLTGIGAGGVYSGRRRAQAEAAQRKGPAGAGGGNGGGKGGGKGAAGGKRKRGGEGERAEPRDELKDEHAIRRARVEKERKQGKAGAGKKPRGNGEPGRERGAMRKSKQKPLHTKSKMIVRTKGSGRGSKRTR
jgi:hypothetical protein